MTCILPLPQFKLVFHYCKLLLFVIVENLSSHNWLRVDEVQGVNPLNKSNNFCLHLFITAGLRYKIHND